MTTRLISAESVTKGHPDKLCDQVSDALLDAYLTADPNSRVAVETFAVGGRIVVGGEVRSNGNVNVEKVVRETVSTIGYNSVSEDGFSAWSCDVENIIQQQSQEIAAGVESSFEQRQSEHSLVDPHDALGAGDQGIMFGYAEDAPNFMPIQIELAHRLSRRLTSLRESTSDGARILRPDGKTQVTIEYVDGVATRIDTILISTQHSRNIPLSEVREFVQKSVIDPVIMEYRSDLVSHGSRVDLGIDDTKYIINPAGSFVLGGPAADTGLTGRKIIADTYGGAARHGGGAFSGKDPSKVDRSAAYALRWIAKSVVSAGLAEKVEIQVAYAIGVARPVGLYVDTFGTGLHDDDVLSQIIIQVFDLRPSAIIEGLDLTKPRYLATASGGHFGRADHIFSWENTFQRSEALQNASRLIRESDSAVITVAS